MQMDAALDAFPANLQDQQRVGQKSCFIQVLVLVWDAVDGLNNVIQVVRQAQRITAHTGRASAMTMCLNLSGKAPGVSTSTGTPSKWRSL